MYNEYIKWGIIEMKYRLSNDKSDSLMDEKELLLCAEIAFSGGLFEEMPKTGDEAVDLFENIGIDIEVVK